MTKFPNLKLPIISATEFSSDKLEDTLEEADEEGNESFTGKSGRGMGRFEIVRVSA